MFDLPTIFRQAKSSVKRKESSYMKLFTAMLSFVPSRSLFMLHLVGEIMWFASCIDVVTCFTVVPDQRHHRIHKILNDFRDGKEAILRNIKPSPMRSLEVVDTHERGMTADMLLDVPIPLADWDVVPRGSHASQGTQSTAVESLILVPLNFEDDIKTLIDIETPYYALKNEHSIIDESTGESVGFVCTVRREMPISRENGGIAFGEVGRHTAASATVASALKNTKRGRFHYLASDYTCVVGPLEGIAKGVLSQARNCLGHLLFSNLDDNEFIIFCRCNELTKRAAHCDIYLETNDTTWHVNINMSLVSAALFNKKYPLTDPEDKITCTDCSPYTSIDGSCLENKKWYPERAVHDWVTLEASLPTLSACECIGHFYEGCLRAVPHSVMLLHNGDLIGEAVSRLTGCTIPYKKLNHDYAAVLFEHREYDGTVFSEHIGHNSHGTASFDNDYGIKMQYWECQPENLNIAETDGLQLQVKTYLKDGELGEPGSTYCVECLVNEKGSKMVCYKAKGTFILDLVH